ncbi:MAG TPA: AmmeMemoRadiSam system protein A [Casimicrobiaceae bacterium]
MSVVRDETLGLALVSIARRAIGARLGFAGEEPAAHAKLAAPGATFVTLFCNAELRGCIGSLQPLRALGEDVRENAINAAFHDPRFPPLAQAEFGATSIEVSLLSPSMRQCFAAEEELLARLRPGVDGVTLEYGRCRGTFLPQVWDALPEARLFLAELKRKAGLPGDFWSPQLNVALYQVTKWKESEFTRPQVLQ